MVDVLGRVVEGVGRREDWKRSSGGAEDMVDVEGGGKAKAGSDGGDKKEGTRREGGGWVARDFVSDAVLREGE